MLWTVFWIVLIGLVIVNVGLQMFNGLLNLPETLRVQRENRAREALLRPPPVDQATQLARIRAGNARYYATLAPKGKPRIRVYPHLTRVHD